MNRKRLARVVVPAVAVALVVALTLLLLHHAPLRLAILEPVTWMFSDIHSTLSTLPQALIWAAGLLIGCAILIASWRRLLAGLTVRSQRARRRVVRPHNANAIAGLARDLARSPRHHVSRVRVVRELSVLAVRLLAQREGVPLEQARKLLQSGQWPDDPLVRRFFGSRRDDAKSIPKHAFVDAARTTLAFLERYHQEV